MTKLREDLSVMTGYELERFESAIGLRIRYGKTENEAEDATTPTILLLPEEVRELVHDLLEQVEKLEAGQAPDDKPPLH